MMTQSSHTLVSSTRTRLLLLLLAAVACVALFASHAPAAQASCGTNENCAWTGSFYTGAEYFLGCTTAPGWIAGTPTIFSVKNHCGIFQEFGWQEGGSINWKACMSPGGERPNPGRLNVYRYRGTC